MMKDTFHTERISLLEGSKYDLGLFHHFEGLFSWQWYYQNIICMAEIEMNSAMTAYFWFSERI